jgi:hypothetical protein
VGTRRAEAAGIAAVVCLLAPFVSMAMMTLAAGPEGGLGSINDHAFLLAFVNIPIALGAAILAAAFAPAFARAPRFLLAALMGATGSAAWISLVNGRFALELSLPWMTAGATAMALSAGIIAGRRRAAVVAAAIVWILGTVGGTKPVVAFMSGEQRLELVFVHWLPGDTPLSAALAPLDVDDHLRGELDRRGLTGMIEVEYGRHVHGHHGAQARAIILMRHAEFRRVWLPQPDAATILYVQEDDGWRRYPAEAPTLPRAIRLDPDDRQTSYEAVAADGSRRGGSAFYWPADKPWTPRPPTVR